MNLLNKLIKKIINYLSQNIINLKIFQNIKRKHNYKNFSIILPFNHSLPQYQRSFPKYDKILPIISKYISNNKTIIDVGANVGDSLAAMVDSNSRSTYLCIEPEDEFYTYLKKNIKIINKKIPHLKVYSLKELVGKKIKDASLNKKNGTAKASLINGNIMSKSLDDIIDNNKDIDEVGFIKIDVDGYDYDALESSLKTIKKHKPLLFFECYYESVHQKLNYENIIKKLYKLGYSRWTVFDNFGETIVSTSNIKIIFNLIDYVWQQNLGKTHRTIYYYDLLAVTDNNKKIETKILNQLNNL